MFSNLLNYGLQLERQFMFVMSLFFLVLTFVIFAFKFTNLLKNKTPIYISSGISFGLFFVFLVFSTFTSIPSSTVGVVTTFGKVNEHTLNEGLSFLLPWEQANKVFIGMDVAATQKAEAASKDLQSIHADLTANFHVIASEARDIYKMTPNLVYKESFVVPAMNEVFKAVVAKYTAEELITHRQEVSSNITESLNARLQQYHLKVQTVNLVNFGFSRAFDAAIEEKVTALQKATTAENNLRRVKFEAEQRIAQAEGEAKAIAIQSAAIEKSGGQAYVQLQAIEKWNGVLPQYMTGGTPVPFVGIK